MSGSFSSSDLSRSETLARRGDKSFKIAMIRARRIGTENFTVGVVTAPCTDNPKFVPHQAMPLLSMNASPAALCAEMVTETEKFIASSR
jgi:hypothetical protein